MTAPIATDTDLCVAFKQGDQVAYTTLMERYYHPLYRYGMKLTFDKELVKDCIHEVFLESWCHRTAIDVVDTELGRM